jgi:hypothetical protein
MRHFCTYFDHRYLSRGLALHESLGRHCPDFRLWVLCLDDIAADALEQLALANTNIIRLADFLRGDDALQAARLDRSTMEFYFTCTPSLPLYVLTRQTDVGIITYLDADLYFFSSPEPLFDQMSDRSIAVTPHRFSPELDDYRRYGLYNVGWNSFRNDETGLACLRWWRDRCLEWCFDRLEDGKFADQKYLDEWPALFKHVAVLDHPGANLAAWNLSGSRLAHRAGVTTVNDEPLVFYHFHGVKKINAVLYDIALSPYRVKPCEVLRRHVLTPYLRSLRGIEERLTRLDDRLRPSAMPLRIATVDDLPRLPLWRRLARPIKSGFALVYGILDRRHVLYLARRIL